ncbi:UDP-N-acetylglucosamine 1-carboxyvinyltransferase [Oleidesulfovibrio sp.]|uniref:UDP-N-acetylglucosamine 1-carboxyvinyltransferase n=1 Tax=Oleidesulfovibrio sp. TaxID=2909707 RepID=UPI003A8C7342
MDKLVIKGGTPLEGSIRVSGSKNASLPILMASILLEEPVIFRNVPRLRDIYTTNKLLGILGCPAEFEGDSVYVKPCDLNPEAPYDLVKTMRASVLCLGPLLARLGEARVAYPGGCAIGARPVDLHLSALEKMGAEFELDSGYIVGRCKQLTGAHIRFDFPTVGGTENLLMAATLAKGETVLENAAREPEVIDLANFLCACGADITGQGTDVIRIRGVERLHGCDYRIMPDRIEAGTFMVAAAITKGNLLIEDCPDDALDAVSQKLRDMGLSVVSEEGGTRVKYQGHLESTDIVTHPYPGFPTDMQAQFMALMCVADGFGMVEETIFENRFMHVLELVRMGADVRLVGRTARVRGGRALRGAPVMASDLRASASLVLAGLAAEGETHVQRIYHLDRGYERIEEKLCPVGADIQRVPE